MVRAHDITSVRKFNEKLKALREHGKILTHDIAVLRRKTAVHELDDVQRRFGWMYKQIKDVAAEFNKEVQRMEDLLERVKEI